MTGVCVNEGGSTVDPVRLIGSPVVTYAPANNVGKSKAVISNYFFVGDEVIIEWERIGSATPKSRP
jgi:hypothetical protein